MKTYLSEDDEGRGICQETYEFHGEKALSSAQDAVISYEDKNCHCEIYEVKSVYKTRNRKRY